MDTDLLVQRVATRFAAEVGGSGDFVKALESKLHLDGRRVHFDNHNRFSGGYDTVYVNFYNLPGEKSRDGAESENNRMMFVISGFGKETPNSPPPSGKVKVEMSVSALPREYKLRAKTGTPDQIVKYLSDFINKVVKEVEPKLMK